jgi:hypothetical protein
MTINGSAGVLDANGNRVFNVTSYSVGNGKPLLRATSSPYALCRIRRSIDVG